MSAASCDRACRHRDARVDLEPQPGHDRSHHAGRRRQHVQRVLVAGQVLLDQEAPVARQVVQASRIGHHPHAA